MAFRAIQAADRNPAQELIENVEMLSVYQAYAVLIFAFSYFNSMLVPSSDPTQWREETERVANKLKNADTKNIISGSWMGHLTVLKEFVKNSNISSSSSILDAESDKNNSVDNSSLRNSQRRESRAVIVSNLNLLKNQLNDQNSIMKRNENIINTREKIASLSREYSENKKVR